MSAEISGYMHEDYARSMSALGVPCFLPHSGGWLIERPIPNSALKDAVGCYPLFMCQNWGRLDEDLRDLSARVVTVTIVTDPFGEYDRKLIEETFPDLHDPYKRHFVIDLSCYSSEEISAHHRRHLKRALSSVSVEVFDDPIDKIEQWFELYSNLIRRHAIDGVARFSQESLLHQLSTPGIVALGARRGSEIVGMNLWFQQGDRAYYHLGAYSDIGYEFGASFALFSTAIDYFGSKGVQWLCLGAGISRDGKDGLSRFKRGWANGERIVYLCGRVNDAERYRELVDGAGVSAGGFFPAYRTLNVVAGISSIDSAPL